MNNNTINLILRFEVIELTLMLLKFTISAVKSFKPTLLNVKTASEKKVYRKLLGIMKSTLEGRWFAWMVGTSIVL